MSEDNMDVYHLIPVTDVKVEPDAEVAVESNMHDEYGTNDVDETKLQRKTDGSFMAVEVNCELDSIDDKPTGCERDVKPELDSKDRKHPRDETSEPYRMMDSGEDLYSCFLCESRFSYKRSLHEHLNTHKHRNVTRLDCDGDIYSDSEHINQVGGRVDVSETTHEDRSRPFKCSICDKRFTQRWNMKVHEQRHVERRRFSCPVCRRDYPVARALSAHMNIHEGKFKCTECGKCFVGNRALRVHGRRHSGDKPFECSVCSKRFTESDDLKRHVTIHTGDKPYHCHVCQKAFRQAGNLYVHMRVHTGERPFSCTVCSRSFIDSGKLRKHARVHMNDVAARPHVCDQCGKRLTSKRTLEQHRFTHSEEKPFVCRVCQTRFSRKESLVQHESLHGDSVFACPLCEKRFKAERYLKRHVVSCCSHAAAPEEQEQSRLDVNTV